MTWLLAKYRNKLTGHCHYIPVEGCEHAEWILRCMNDPGEYEFVELYKKQEDKGEQVYGFEKSIGINLY